MQVGKNKIKIKNKSKNQKKELKQSEISVRFRFSSDRISVRFNKFLHWFDFVRTQTEPNHLHPLLTRQVSEILLIQCPY